MKLTLAGLGLLVVLAAVPALGQACAMCYSSAAASTRQGQQAISRGVLVLLVPPVGVMSLGVGLAFRYAKKRDRDAEGEDTTTACWEEE